MRVIDCGMCETGKEFVRIYVFNRTFNVPFHHRGPSVANNMRMSSEY